MNGQHISRGDTVRDMNGKVRKVRRVIRSIAYELDGEPEQFYQPDEVERIGPWLGQRVGQLYRKKRSRELRELCDTLLQWRKEAKAKGISVEVLLRERVSTSQKK